jgi:hypothetical protein
MDRRDQLLGRADRVLEQRAAPPQHTAARGKRGRQPSAGGDFYLRETEDAPASS